MIDDFGPDFDAEGQPLEEGESDRVRSEEEHAQAAGGPPARAEARRGRRGAEAEREPEEVTA